MQESCSLMNKAKHVPLLFEIHMAVSTKWRNKSPKSWDGNLFSLNIFQIML